MGLMLAPWAIAVGLVSGPGVLAHLLAHGLFLIVAGYGVLTVTLPAGVRPSALVLAPAVGDLTIAALTSFCVRLDMPLGRVWPLWLLLAGLGTLALWRDRLALVRERLAHGVALVVLSALICVVYALPGIRHDAVRRPDGSYNWIYVDTQYFHSIAASIKYCEGKPKMAGTATANLRYHFGEYAVAAATSRFTAIDLGDALVRVTRSASLWGLVLSAYGVGLLLSRRAGNGTFGGIAAVAGLFFYGSLLSLFTDAANSTSPVTGAILFRIPDVAVLADGGPFIHLILGHSMLHGLVAITAVLGLCLLRSDDPTPGDWRRYCCLALPALAVPTDSPAALYCAALAAVLLFWRQRLAPRAWLMLAAMAALFCGAWLLMAFERSQVGAHATIQFDNVTQWWPLVMLVTVGLGCRLTGLDWVRWPLEDPMSVLVSATVVGLLGFTLYLRLYFGNERYGVYFLECMFSLFAFSRLPPHFWRSGPRQRLVASWLGWVKRGLLVLFLLGVTIGVVGLFRADHHSGVKGFSVKLPLTLLLLALAWWLSSWMRRRPRAAAVASAAGLGLLAIGCLAWISAWVNFGLGRMRLDITLTPGEVRGLDRLRELTGPHERFATNRHAIDRLTFLPEKSYGYAALSERPVLLEGTRLEAETFLPDFPTLLAENDALFTTTDPATLRRLAAKYGVNWLVARPGTDLALPRPRPAWLEAVGDTGDLSIYRIRPLPPDLPPRP